MSEHNNAAERGNEKEASTADSTKANSVEFVATIDRALGLVESLKRDLTPHLAREVENLEQDLKVLESWADDSEEEGVEALAGAPVVAETAQTRVDRLQDEVGQGAPDLAERLEKIDDAIEDIEDIVDALAITTGAYVTYVNRSFADRYFDAQVTIESLLIAGLEDDIENIREQVDEFGLFPQDGLFGENVTDLAFPANREVGLGEENRTYWASTSDGGKIA